MTKNRDRYPLGEQSLIENNQTVVVLDEHGEVIGKTYPKRAKGLIKKGRAEFLSENVIRIKNSCPTEKSEESIMEINEKVINNQSNESVENAVEIELKTPERKHEYIFFKPRDYFDNPDIRSNRNARYMHLLPNGSFEEVYKVGAWPGGWVFSGICSKFIPVSKDTDYTFVFWLNGGENENKDELCQLLVIYSDGQAERATSEEYHQNYRYYLNRGKVKPIKTIDGWYLFAIDLPKADKSFVEFRFEADKAPTYLREAAAPEFYADMPDTYDEYAAYRPQRHNIFFEDGWPADDPNTHGNWYSTAAIKRRLEKEANGEIEEEPKTEPMPEPETKRDSGWDNLAKLVAENIDLDEIASNIDTSDIADYIDLDDIADNIDLDDIVSNIDLDDIASSIDMDELAESVADKLDLDDLADKIAERLDIRSIIEEILND